MVTRQQNITPACVRIAAIGDLSGYVADERIAVRGLAVVPGFIDIHSHAVRGSRKKSGTFARVLAHYVRDKQVISTGEAIYKMSLFPAQRIGLSERGRIETGAMADIAVMDLDTVQDHASFDQPHQYSSGVKHVLVNGVMVLRDGEMTGERPGRSLRSR